MSDTYPLGQNLTRLLKAKGRGAASALARAIRVNRAYICQLQGATRINPSEEKLRAIAHYFGVTVEFLITGEGGNAPQPISLTDFTTEELLRELLCRHLETERAIQKLATRAGRKQP